MAGRGVIVDFDFAVANVVLDKLSGKTAKSVVEDVLASVEVPPRTEEMFRGR